MSKRLSADEWVAARLAWESDPSLTAARLAEAVGISKQAVSVRIKRDAEAGNPWVKKVTQAEIAERAQVMADRVKQDPQPSAPKVDAVDSSVNQKEMGTHERVPTGVPDPVAERAAVIARHRKEWAAPRGLSYGAMKAKDFEQAKLAKISSETLSIIQKGERAAWGLDAADPADKPVVIIERSGAGG